VIFRLNSLKCGKEYRGISLTRLKMSGRPSSFRCIKKNELNLSILNTLIIYGIIIYGIHLKCKRNINIEKLRIKKSGAGI
jgi:hypothetical protein